MFKKVHEKGLLPTYFDSTKLSSGQSVCMFFYKEANEDGREVYSVGLGVGKTRKQVFNTFLGDSRFLEGKETGRAGGESLAWARTTLFKFEDWIQTVSVLPVRIIVGWADDRRKNVYVHYLCKHGYKKYGERWIVKDL